MIRLILILILFINSLYAGWVSKQQYINLIKKQKFLKKEVNKLGLPSKTVDIFLGIYLRESSIGLKPYGDKEEDVYFYKHMGKRVYITKEQYRKSKRFKNGSGRYIKVKYWGKYWVKKVYYIEGDPVPIHRASLGDYNITFPTILVTIREAKLKEYYRYISEDKKRLINKVELVNRAIRDGRFNTIIALNYFKLNYEEAKKRGYKKPLERAISRHNGFWYNYKYIKLIKKDIKYVLNAIKENRWNVDIRKIR